MSKRSNELLLGDMVEAIDKIERYIASMSAKQFLSDEKTVDAVVRNFEIIGEAANQLSSDFKNNNPQIPWNKIIGLRHRIVHSYFGIDLMLVWSIVENDLPVLRTALHMLLKDSENPSAQSIKL